MPTKNRVDTAYQTECLLRATNWYWAAHTNCIQYLTDRYLPYKKLKCKERAISELRHAQFQLKTLSIITGIDTFTHKI